MKMSTIVTRQGRDIFDAIETLCRDTKREVTRLMISCILWFLERKLEGELFFFGREKIEGAFWMNE